MMENSPGETTTQGPQVAAGPSAEGAGPAQASKENQTGSEKDEKKEN